MYLMHPVKEGEDYGKGVIFYLRENKVRGGVKPSFYTNNHFEK